MSDAFDWSTYLSIFHESRAGVAEDILSRAYSGPSTPYRWLARAVSRRADTVLDIASGAGAMSRELAREGRTIVGVDMSVAELTLAASRSDDPWLCADGRALPVADESFDAVTSSMGVVVIRPADQLFREVARVLKPGGVFAFMAPTVRPLRLVETARGWELDALVPSDELRTFIVDRIRSAQATQDTFTTPAGIDARLAEQRRSTTVELVVPQGYRWAVDRYAESTEIVESDEGDVRVRAQFLPPVAERVGLVIVTAPDSFVLHPEELKSAGAQMAQVLLAHHGLA